MQTRTSRCKLAPPLQQKQCESNRTVLCSLSYAFVFMQMEATLLKDSHSFHGKWRVQQSAAHSAASADLLDYKMPARAEKEKEKGLALNVLCTTLAKNLVPERGKKKKKSSCKCSTNLARWSGLTTKTTIHSEYPDFCCQI